MLPSIQTHSVPYKLNIFYFQLSVKTKHKTNKTALYRFKNLKTINLLTLSNQSGFDFTFVKFLHKTLPLFAQIIESNQYSALKAFMFYVPVRPSKQKKIVRRRRCLFFNIKPTALNALSKLQVEPLNVFNYWLRTFKAIIKTLKNNSGCLSKTKLQRLKLKRYTYLISKFSAHRHSSANTKTIRSLYANKLFFYRKNVKSRQLTYANIRSKTLRLSLLSAHKTGRKRFKKSVSRLTKGDYLKAELAAASKRSAHEDLRILKSTKLKRKQNVNLKWARRLKKQYRRRMVLRVLLKKTAKRSHKLYVRKHKIALSRPVFNGKLADALKNFQGWSSMGDLNQQTSTKKRSLFAMMHEERERLKKENPNNYAITYVSPVKFNPNEFAENKRVLPFNLYLNKNLNNTENTPATNKQYWLSSGVKKQTTAVVKHLTEKQFFKKEFGFFTKINNKDWTVPVRYWIANGSKKYYKRVRYHTRKQSNLKKRLAINFLKTHTNVYQNYNSLLQVIFKTLFRRPNYKQIVNNLVVYLTQRNTVNFIFLKKRKKMYQLFFYWLTNAVNLFKFKIKNKRQYTASIKLKNLKVYKKALYTRLKNKKDKAINISAKLKKRTQIYTRIEEVVKGGIVLEAGKDTAPNNQTPMRLNHAFLLFFNRVSRYYKNKLYGFKIKLKKAQRRNIKILKKLKKEIKQNRKFVRYYKQRKALARVNKTHKDKRALRGVFTVLPFKIRKSIYTKTLPILRKKKPNQQKRFLVVKRRKIFKSKRLKSAYTRGSFLSATIDRRDTFVRLLKGKTSFKRAKYKSIAKKNTKKTSIVKARQCRFLLSFANLTLYGLKKPKKTKKLTLTRLKPLRYMKKMLKKVRRRYNVFRSRLKALYFKSMRRPTYTRLARRPWKIQWKRLTKSLKRRNNSRLKKHLLRSVHKAVKRSHFFTFSEKNKYSATKALKYRYLLTELYRADLSVPSNGIKLRTQTPVAGVSQNIKKHQLPFYNTNTYQSLTERITLNTSDVHTYHQVQGLLSPRLFNMFKRRVYTALKNVFQFPLSSIKRHKIKHNYNIALTRRLPAAYNYKKTPMFDLNFKLKQQPLTRNKRGGKVLFTLVAKPNRRRKERHRVKQLNYKNLKFKFLNFFVLNFFSHKNTNYTFEDFVKYRVAARSWPKHNNLNRNEKKRSMRLRTRINYIRVKEQVPAEPCTKHKQ